MRIAIIGQQDFGKAVLEAFVARGDTVVGVFCAPDKAGAKPDPFKLAAQERGLPLFQFASLRSPEAQTALRELQADLGIMAFVLQFVPQELVCIPKHGMVQFHPSLLPRYRGPSSINWPIIRGDTETGLTIFRPTDGLDEGPVILQKHTPIGPDDTLGSVYFDRLFPMGVQAMLEAADLVTKAQHHEHHQNEGLATYEGWCRQDASRINWHSHVDVVYNLIRGCNPAPGAWTTFAGQKIQIFDSAKSVFRRFKDVEGHVAEVTKIGDASFTVSAQGGHIEVLKAKAEGGKKDAGAVVARAMGLKVGSVLGG
jgi:methionyl-tRNA formyltransferase